MIVLIALLAARQEALPTASDVVSKMMAKYHEAKTIKGEATTTVVVGGQQLVIKSTIQLERPTKLYLRQDVLNQGMTFVVTSDGKEFSYQKPINTSSTDRNPKTRLIESVTAGLGLGDLYRAAGQSLAERSAVLDLLISDVRDLNMLRDQWVSLKLTGKEDLNGESVYRIVGKWRLNRASQTTANYGLFITPDGDLRKYVVDQLPGAVKLSKDDYDGPVSRTFVVNATVGADLEPSLFTVLK